MAFFEGNKMTGGYGDGPDIINSCTINVNKGEIVAILGPKIATISPLLTLMVHEEIISTPPYPPVIPFPSKKDINQYLH